MSTIIRFLKRIYVFIFNKFKDFRSLLLNNSYFFLYKFFSNNTKVINSLLYAFLAYLSYLFFYDLNFYNAIQIFVFSILSFAISMYISDRYKYSNNLFIKILQKLVFISIKFVLIVFLLSIFDISLFNTILCDSEDEENSEDKYNNLFNFLNFPSLLI